jgi:hypothetical protein
MQQHAGPLPPAPNIAHPGIMVSDITAKFAEAVKSALIQETLNQP